METDFDWADVKGSTLTTTGGAFSQAEFFDERLKWFGTVRGRLGYLATDNLLAFVTGGLAYGRVERTATDSNVGSVGIGTAQGATGFSFHCVTAATCFTGTTANTAAGWTIGGRT